MTTRPVARILKGSRQKPSPSTLEVTMFDETDERIRVVAAHENRIEDEIEIGWFPPSQVNALLGVARNVPAWFDLEDEGVGAVPTGDYHWTFSANEGVQFKVLYRTE